MMTLPAVFVMLLSLRSVYYWLAPHRNQPGELRRSRHCCLAAQRHLITATFPGQRLLKARWIERIVRAADVLLQNIPSIQHQGQPSFSKCTFTPEALALPVLSQA
jgi:hypothetical protein